MYLELTCLDVDKKTILDLEPDEAREFFLNQEMYCSLILPPYLEFTPLLKAISINLSEMINTGQEEEVTSLLKKAKSHENVNYKLMINKDGQYAWRKIELINPILYVYLVHILTEKKNWEELLGRFRDFQENKKIISAGIPPYKQKYDKNDKENKKKKETYLKKTVLNWWNNVEQESLVLALDYSCLVGTDITNCYGSLYTHSIAWAIYGKKEAKNGMHNKKNDENKKLLGNKIDEIIRCMSYGQTNGIPTGSVLMDFIAEIVLGYIDLQLGEELEKLKMDYKIIRYRDDYKIFVNDLHQGKTIIKILSKILIEFGFRLNDQKTFFGKDVISSAIKEDKLHTILLRSEQNGIVHQLVNRYNIEKRIEKGKRDGKV